MKPISLIALILAALMLMGALCACGVPIPDPSGTGTQNPADTETQEDLSLNLPDDLNYGDDEITVISRYREGWTSGEIAAEKIEGEPVNDAIFERNRDVETRLGVKIVSVEMDNHDPSEVVNKVALSVKAGTHEYDIMAAACYTAINQSLSGTFANLRDTEYLDFDKPWWSQGFNEVVEYKGCQFAVTGSAVLSLYRFAFVTVFNKDLFTDVGQPFLYEDVASGSWTLDRQIELVPLFHQDNGNGKQDREGDIYGLVSNDFISVDPYWSSCKVNIIQKNGDGDYEMVFDSGKLHDVCEKTMQLFYGCGDATYNFKHEGLDDEQAYIRQMFADGYAAMATVRVLELETGEIRNMEQQFGVVPMPKYDAAQDGYRTLLHDQFTVFCVPTTARGERLNEISAVMEAMGYGSHRTVKPAYYESTLRTKIAQDPQSAEMFDIVIDNIYIDAGIIYTNALSNFHDQFRQIMGKGQNTVSSDYKSLNTKAKKALTLMTKKLDKLVDNQ